MVTATQAACAGEAAITPTKRLPLFNGVSLAGLSTWLVDSRGGDPRKVFTVTNGMLRISGNGLGYVRSVGAFQNYRLLVEFRWGSRNWGWGDRVGRARDSGVFLHSIGPDGNSHDGKGAFRAAIECQVFQGATGDFLLIRGNDAEGKLIAPSITSTVAEESDPDGWPFYAPESNRRKTITRWGRLNWLGKDKGWKDELDFRGARDVEKPYGEWNRLECVCEEKRIQVYLNGTKVNEAWDVYPSAGNILLQCEGSEIFFRKFELHPLVR